MQAVEPQTEDFLRLHQTVLEWVAREADPDKILTDLCGLIAELMPGGICIVMTLDSDQGTLSVDAAPGVHPDIIEAFSGLVPAEGSGSCGSAVRTGEPVFAEDTFEDPRWAVARPLAERFGIRSCWSIPLFSHEGVILGTFSISRGEVGAPTPGQEQLLATAGHLAGIVVDRRRVREELQRQERLVDSIVEGSDDAIFAKDRAGHYLLVNSWLARSLGTTPANMLGKTDRDFFSAEEAEGIAEWDRRVFETGQALNYELDIEEPVRGERTYLVSKTPLRTPEGEIRGLIGIGRDVTEMRSTQRAVQEAQRLESLGVLTGGIAHDFNNLLTGVLGHAELSLSRPPGDPRNERSLREISRAATRASELIEQMLAYAGQRATEPRPLDLPALVAETSALLQSSVAKNAELLVEAATDLNHVLADPSQLRQVLMNLLVNASEALEGAPGRIVIRMSNYTGTANAGSAGEQPRPSAGYVELVVEDDGCGMPPETLARIFDPFYSTKFSGRGLGLAATQGIIATHGGWIDVESHPGQGSVFSIVLPATERAQAAVPVDEPAPAEGRGTILVVDDEEIVRTLASSVLEERGYEVLLASDGEEAVRLIREHARDLALVVLDLTMPRLSGHDAFVQIRALCADLAVVLSSGFAEPEATAGFEPGDLAGYLEKPYRPSNLLAAVRTALGEPAPS